MGEAMQYDLLIRNGFVVDYATDMEKYADVAISDGRIARIADAIDAGQAKEIFDVEGHTVVPGIIDPHMHASEWLGGRAAHRMLALAGVTSALDMSGPGESVLALTREFGVGINIATIEYVRPGHTVKDTDPKKDEIAALIGNVLNRGSIGIKLLGGHYPLTPEATARCIEIAAESHAYVAFHAGTLANGSNIDGFCEAVALSAGHPLHLAHINAYCRGQVKPYMEEAEIAVKTLTDNPHILSEAYLSPMNGTSAAIVDGLPASHVTRRCLLTGGFEATEQGMQAAIEAGWAQLNYPCAGEMILLTGKDAVAYWRSKNTDASVSFAVNPPEPRIRLAAAKRPDGNFVVDAISTDGGGIPRNVIIPMGLALLDLGVLTWKEFVQKTSHNPARMLALTKKGSLAEGKDADITVIDRKKRAASMSVVGGKLCTYKGYVVGKGGRVITTQAGSAHVKALGLEAVITDLSGRCFVR
jgi:imidazolonepropionase-like amidohydrolase